MKEVVNPLHGVPISYWSVLIVEGENLDPQGALLLSHQSYLFLVWDFAPSCPRFLSVFLLPFCYYYYYASFLLLFSCAKYPVWDPYCL